jgi:hypothetical protein
MKGKARLDSISGDSPISVRIQGQEADSSSLLYLTESMSRFSYYPPDRIREEMIASRVSGDPRGFSSNRARDLLKNPYVHRIEIPGISKRGFISPVGRSAPTYYEFDWIGAYHEKGMTISRIRIEAEREHDPVFRGTVEVVEGDWRIKALDLQVPSEAPLEFVDSLRIKQEYVEWQDEEWLPLSLEEIYWFGALGIEAKYSMIGRCSEHRALETPSESSRERFRVRQKALDKDTGYWEEERPYVLEEEERDHYRKADSIDRVTKSKPYLDSLDSAENRLEASEILYSGYRHQNSFDSTSWGVNSIPSALGFNTVEGWRFRFKPYYRQRLSGHRYRRYQVNMRYGLASERFFLKGSVTLGSDPLHSERWHLKAGTDLRPVNRTDPLPEWLNSVYSLTRQRNFLKFYSTRFIDLSYRREWSNGLYGELSLGWEERDVPPNNSSQTWFPRSDAKYSPNRFHPSLETPSRILRPSIDWTWRPVQRYERYPNEKRVIETPYPEFYGELEGAVPLDGTYSRYARVELGVGDYFELGLGGRLRMDLRVGDHFFQKDRMAIMDRKHFRGNRTLWLHSGQEGRGIDPWGSHRLRSFHTLPYFSHFTRGRYGTAHIQQRFQGALLNKLPLVRRLNWHVLLGGNGLYTSDQGTYGEVYVGLENIFKVLRFDVALPVHPRLESTPYWRVGFSSSLL